MLGMIRDEDMTAAEIEFPGIRAIYLAWGDKPRTFLELVARYLGMAPGYRTESASPTPEPRQRRSET